MVIFIFKSFAGTVPGICNVYTFIGKRYIYIRTRELKGLKYFRIQR